MNIEELQRKHQDIWVADDLKLEFKQHRNLSIQFAIENLEECESFEDRYRRIEELKQYLNETV
jgi:hypothetical protein